MQKRNYLAFIILGIIFSANIVVFCNFAPDPFRFKWDDMIASVKNNIATLPSYAQYPAGATNWTRYADACFDDLMIEDASWTVWNAGPGTSVVGYRPYVKGTDGWDGVNRTREHLELMACMDALLPQYRYLQLIPNATRQALVNQLIANLSMFYKPVLRQAMNLPGEQIHDSWYFLENSVLKWGELYRISNMTTLYNMYFDSLAAAITAAKRCDYLFPQFLNATTLESTWGNDHNYGSAGLLAYALVSAYQMTGNVSYLVEAENCLVAMRSVQYPSSLVYEPQELSSAAAAAARMVNISSVIGSAVDYAGLAMDFFYAGEQMLFYADGNVMFTSNDYVHMPWLPASWRDGMHIPCGTSNIYGPAFKENVETIMFWVDLLKILHTQPGFDPNAVLKIMNLNRIKNFNFFSPCIADEHERAYGPITLQYVPYEDIDNVGRQSYETDQDQNKAGFIGKEIYGAGEVFWNFMLFEALGVAGDKNVMLVNLNMFDTIYPATLQDRRYVAFNPYDTPSDLAFTLLQITGNYNVFANGQYVDTCSPGESFILNIPAIGSAYITLTPA